MRKLLVLVLVLSVTGLTGCQKTSQDRQTIIKNDVTKYSCVIEYDGCEYITWPGSHNEIGLTHKGNCKNPQHIYKKVK